MYLNAELSYSLTCESLHYLFVARILGSVLLFEELLPTNPSLLNDVLSMRLSALALTNRSFSEGAE